MILSYVKDQKLGQEEELDWPDKEALANNT